MKISDSIWGAVETFDHFFQPTGFHEVYIPPPSDATLAAFERAGLKITNLGKNPVFINGTRLDPEKFSLTGADELKCGAIHRQLCVLAPIDDLCDYSAMLAQLSPADIDTLFPAVTHPAVQKGDVLAIMAMRAPLPAPEPAIPEAKPSPAGLGCIAGMDHRLGGWK